MKQCPLLEKRHRKGQGPGMLSQKECEFRCLRYFIEPNYSITWFWILNDLTFQNAVPSTVERNNFLPRELWQSN